MQNDIFSIRKGRAGIGQSSRSTNASRIAYNMPALPFAFMVSAINQHYY